MPVPAHLSAEGDDDDDAPSDHPCHPDAARLRIPSDDRGHAMKTVVALPGEGIGPEVVDATCEVLVGTGLPLKILTPLQGAAAVKSHGVPLPDESKQAARAADGVLFGAAGGPDTSAVVGWLRWEMSAWGGARLIKFHPGMRSPLADPEGIDYVIVRENSEGMYPGREGDLEDLARVMPDLKDKSGKTVKEYGPGRFAVKVVTPVGAERIARFACRLAKARKARGKPGKVTCVTKSNVMPRSDGLFRETAERVVREVGGLEFEHFYVDDCLAPPGALPEVDGRGAVDEPLRRHPLRPRRGDGGWPRAGAVRLLRRRLGLLRVGARLGARHRGPRHRESDGDHSLRGDDARAHGSRGRGRAARGGGGARLPRRQGAHARPGRHGKTREMAQAVLAAYRNA
jgi:hypothetical protein